MSPAPALVTAYVDGACNPNPGRGGWGAVLRRDGELEQHLSGVIPEHPCTNQRAEIYAAIRALSALQVPCRVRVVSYSQYLVRTMNQEFRRRANLELWDRVDAAALPHAVEWCWVRGHSGEEGNEIAHMLAEEAAATSDPLPELEICPPQEDLCPHCGEMHSYACGRLLLLRYVAEKEERCLDGIRICVDCTRGFEEFMTRVGDAQTVDQEWEVDDG